MSVTRIAEKAGVSIATVSRVLNKSRPVAAETEALVLQAMRELDLPVRPLRGPQKHKRARRSSAGRNGNANQTLAIITVGQGYETWFKNPVIASVVGHLMRAAEEARVQMTLLEMPDPAVLSPMLKSGSIGGALAMVDADADGVQLEAIAELMPVVRVMGGQHAPAEVDHVTSDNTGIGYLAANYVLKQNIKHAAIFTTQPRWGLTRLRAQGFVSTLSQAGVDNISGLIHAPQVDATHAIYGTNVIAASTFDGLAQAIKKLSKTGKVGLFCTRDAELEQLQPSLVVAGLDQSNLQVISCDNTLRRTWPSKGDPPPSIDLNLAEVGRIAFGRLLERLEAPDEPPRRILVRPTWAGSDD